MPTSNSVPIAPMKMCSGSNCLDVATDGVLCGDCRRKLEICKPRLCDAQLPGYSLNAMPDFSQQGIRLCRGCDKPIESDTYCRKCLEEIEALITAKPWVMPKWAKTTLTAIGGILLYLLIVYDLTAIVLQLRAGAR